MSDYKPDPYDKMMYEKDQRIRALEQDVTDVAKINVDLMKRNRELEAALAFASAHVGATPHGDNCFLTDEFPGNQCLCGKISTLAEIDSALETIGEGTGPVPEGYHHDGTQWVETKV